MRSLMDAFYSYVISSSWIFLLGWVVLLVVAGVITFRRDLS
jgi:hypothetical protein